MECVTGIAAEVLSKVAELLMIEPIGANCGYLVSYNDNISSLNKALEALEDKKQEVQLKVREDKNNGREILPHVEIWLRKVEEFQGDLGRFKEEEVNRNKKCLGGWCPNLKTRYSFSKNAKKNAEKLVQLKEQKPETISRAAPPLKYAELFATKGIKSFESRNDIVRGVVERLKEEGCNKISICGMGGVGKTTLVREVIKIVEAGKLLDVSVMVTVSQNVNYTNIQDEIAHRLGLTFPDKEPMLERAQRLLNRINKSPGVLIVLDDVWTELDLVSIGIPSNCKVIFTSRNEGECSKMGSQKTFTVNTLSKEDSWALFEDTVSGDVVKKSEIRTTAKNIAEQCGGLPIAIVTVGKALRGKRDKYVWESALKDLRTSSASFSEVEKCIELSYTLLDKRNAKDLLFLCCSFPEDTDIPIEALLREGWGLGMLFQDKDYSLYEARNKTHSLVDDLKACYLLLDSEKKECVKMHDVVRDVIISIASKKEDHKIQCDAEKWRQDRSTTNSCTAISIRTSELVCPGVVDYPKLEIFRAESSVWNEISIPANSFRGMSILKVLYLFKSFIPDASSLFPTLKCLRTLRLEKCTVGDVSIIGKELLALEILSFAGSIIIELPTDIGQLCSLRLLDLTGCDQLCKISSNVLARLHQLEEIYFMTQTCRWMQNLDFLDELQTISHQLKVVEIVVKRVESFVMDLNFKNVSRFLVVVASPALSHDLSAGYMKPNILRLRAVDYNSIKCGKLITHLVQRCEILTIEKVNNLKNIFFGSKEGVELSCLKDLQIRNCSDLVCLTDDGEDYKSMTDLLGLTKLTLINLPNLNCFTRANESHQSMPHFQYLETILIERCKSLDMTFDLQAFQNLKDLSIIKCDSIKHVFTPAIGEVMPQLEKLEIRRCKELSNLVAGSKDHEAEDYNCKGKVKNIVFKKLCHLSLFNLPKLESICANFNEQVEWPSLVYFHIDDCSMLKAPSFQNQMPQESTSLDMVFDPQGFQNLRSLMVSNCHSLTHIFTPVMGKVASELEELKISSCKKMTSLVGESKNHIEVNTTVFKKLHSLSLYDLPKCESICSNYFDTEWPSLRQLDIDGCLVLKSLPLFQIQKHLMQNNVDGITSYSNTLHTNLENSKENRSRHFNSFLEYAPALSRFIHQSNTNKINNKGACEGKQRQLGPFIDVFLFYNLRSLIIKKCNKIHILFSFSSSISLKCLEELKLRDCESIEQIVYLEEIEESTNKILFPKLKNLFLGGLPKIKSFIQGPNNDFDFPSLQTVQIIGCPNMGIFSKGYLNTPKLKDFKIEIEPYASNYVHEGDLNATLKGFKAFVELQHVELLNWNDPHNEGLIYFINSEIDLKMFDRLLMVVPFSEIHVLQNMKKLCVESCGSLVEVFESREEIMDEIIHYELRSMTLRDLPELRLIWGPKLMRLVTFDKLTSITVTFCHSLKSLMPHFIAKGLVHLEYLRVENCKMMEVIVTKEYDDEKREKEGDSCFDLEEEKIKEVYISELPKLLSLTLPYVMHMLQRVINLTIRDCVSLQKIFESEEILDANKGNMITKYEIKRMELKKLPELTHIWGPNMNTRLVRFDKLTSMQIGKCKSLKSLLSYSMATNLVQLGRLEVYGCGMMEVIVTTEDENLDNRGNKDISFFPNLKKLWLSNLPKLECICSQLDCGYDIPLCSEEEEEDNKEINDNQKIHILLPQLNEVTLINVPSLRCFCPGAYDYDLTLSSSSSSTYIEDCRQISSFRNGKVTVSTPNLRHIYLEHKVRLLRETFLRNRLGRRYEKYQVPILGDLNLTIHLFHDERKYKVELQRLDTLGCIEQDGYQHLLAYVMRTRILILENCHKLITCISSPSDMVNHSLFQYLKELFVANCECLQVIFESNDFGETKLSSMRLISLPKLKHIWRDHHSPLSSFKNLGDLKIHKCHDMKFVFANVSVAMSLSSLDFLTVSECNQMEEIIQTENNSFISKGGDKVIFPNFWSINLQKLPELNCFCKSSFCYELSRCTKIDIKECPKMATFCSGTLCAPRLVSFRIENTLYHVDENINEVIRGRGGAKWNIREEPKINFTRK